MIMKTAKSKKEDTNKTRYKYQKKTKKSSVI